jgi:hypothetical protein
MLNPAKGLLRSRRRWVRWLLMLRGRRLRMLWVCGLPLRILLPLWRIAVLLFPLLMLCVGRTHGSEKKEQNSRAHNAP